MRILMIKQYYFTWWIRLRSDVSSLVNLSHLGVVMIVKLVNAAATTEVDILVFYLQSSQALQSSA